jgi:glycosyltransferase involved in cell wall biosynthesis
MPLSIGKVFDACIFRCHFGIVVGIRSQSLRVLHVIDSLIQAGAEALVKDMAPRMRARGLDITVAVLRELDSPFELELRELAIPFLPTARGGLYSPCHLLTLQKNIQRFDVVHVYLFPAQLFAPIAQVLAGRRVPLVLSEGTPHHRRRKKWLHPLEMWMYKRYAAVACASEGIAASLREWLPEINSRISVIENGIDIEKFEQATPCSCASAGVSNGNCVLLYVASFQPRKDHKNLLRAIAQVPGADLLLVGDGDLRRPAERLAQQLGIADRVHFLGRRADVPELLKMADIYVHPPAFEGFGIAAAEAMAAGKPIVATNVPGLAQVVGDAGILVPPSDPAALATQISALMKSRERREKLSQLAMQRACIFSIDHTVSAYIKLYESIASKRFLWVPGKI